jgi:nucleotide-binding universal stress UspA family protein
MTPGEENAMKRVLVPVDGSPASLEAVRAVFREGAGAIARVELLNVQPLFHRHVSRWTSRRSRDAWRSERAERALEPARRILGRGAIAWQCHVATGPTAAAVADAASRLACDEIVIGVTRRGPLAGVLFNSLAARLCEISRVAVRVIPAAEATVIERLAVPAGLGLVALLILADE